MLDAAAYLRRFRRLTSMLRWLARLTLPKALALALAWPVLLLGLALAAVAWFLFGQTQSGNGYLVSFVADPMLSVVLWGPPVVVMLAWLIARRRYRSAT